MKQIQQLKVYLARQYAKLFKQEMFIAVTGSFGKTACIEAIREVLSQKYKTISTQANADPVQAVPSVILKINPSIQKVVLEMGTENQSDMDFYLSIIKPQIAVVTKTKEITEEENKLVRSLDKDGVAVLNYDDSYCRGLAKECGGTVAYYGTDSANCTLWAGNIKVENFATTFELNFGVERIKVDFQLLGLSNVYAALAGALVGIVSGVPLTRIKFALDSIKPLEHHLQVVSGPNGSILLDDTYNSSPDTLEEAIDTLLILPARRRIVVLGEMRGLGDFSEKLYRGIAQKIYKEKLDFVFLGQGDTEFIADELNSLGYRDDRIESNLGNSEIVSKLLRVLDKGDVCLIKGSGAIRLDEVVKRIKKK